MLAVGGAPAGNAAATAQTAAQLLQAALDEARNDAGAPGASAAIVVEGRLIWEGVSGHTDAAAAKPVSSRTVFALASLSKLVTAALVMRLRDEARLSLDDRLAKYVPTLPNASRITVRMLLNHTGGLADYEDASAIDRRLADPYHQWTRAEILREIGRASFRPGARYSYGNTGYVTLGAVIEQASGSTVGSLFRRVFSQPLGLTSCAYHREAALTSDFAEGHSKAGRSTFPRDGFVPTNIWGEVWTDGGLACTAADAATVIDALFGGRVIARASVDEMIPTDENQYGMGISFNDEWLGHDGSYGGFESEGWHDRKQRLTVVALANREDVGAAVEVWNAVVKAWHRTRRAVLQRASLAQGILPDTGLP